jgi:hypothetical protein
MTRSMQLLYNSVYDMDGPRRPGSRLELLTSTVRMEEGARKAAQNTLLPPWR